MKERPILFSGPMVRALLDGTKTQTRRVVKSSLEIAAVGSGDDWNRHKAHPAMQNPPVVLLQNNGRPFSLPCPYGAPGDRLWVRETHMDCGPHGVYYRAEYDGPEPHISVGRWTPSIHMPRSLSRITLEITGVRVERLQDISEDDAIAEGINASMCSAAVSRAPSRGEFLPAAVHGFSHLWECLNAARGHGWHSNPFVWIVAFKRI